MRFALWGLVGGLVLAIGLYVSFRPTLESGLARWPTDAGDTVLNYFILEHTWKAVADPDYRFTMMTPPMFHPEPWVLGYSESFMGTAPAYWLLRAMLPAADAYPLWIILMHALNFIAFVVVGRWLKLAPPVIILGAALWAFAVCQIRLLNHQQLIPRFWMPFAVYYLKKFIEQPNLKDLRKTCIFNGLQMTACINSGALLGYSLFGYFLVGVTFCTGWRTLYRTVRPIWWSYTKACIPGALIWLLAIAPQIAANIGTSAGREYSETLIYMPFPSSWLTPPWDWRYEETFGHYRDMITDERHLFSGVGPLLLLAFSLVAWSICGREQRSLAVKGLLCGLTSIVVAFSATDWGDGEGLSAWYITRFFPGGLAVRAVSRISIVVYLFMTFAGVLGLQAILNRFVLRDWLRNLLASMLMLMLLFEQLPDGFVGYVCENQLGVRADLLYESRIHRSESFHFANVEKRVKPVADLMAGSDAAYVLATDDMLWEVHGQILAMLAGQKANVRVINGYSGRLPKGYLYKPNWTDQEIRDWLGPGFHGRVAVIDPNKHTVRHLVIP